MDPADGDPSVARPGPAGSPRPRRVGSGAASGAAAAILLTAVLFGVAHVVGTAGSPQVVLSDVAGVTLDGVLLGIIYARTHNLAVTWATHYVADVVGLLALVSVFRGI